MKKINKLYCTTFGFEYDLWKGEDYFKHLNDTVPNRWSLDKNKVLAYAKQLMNEYGLEGNVEDYIDIWESKSDERLVVDENGTVIVEYFNKKNDKWGEIYEFRSVYHIK